MGRWGHIPQVMAALRNTAIGGPCQHCGGLPLVSGSAGTGVGSHRDCLRKLNDSDDFECGIAAGQCAMLSQLLSLVN